MESTKQNNIEPLTFDNINEILLRSDIGTIRQFSFTNKKIYQLCNQEHFWQSKLKLDGLPNIIFDEMRHIDYIAVCVQIKNFELWINLYKFMKRAQFEAKVIILINKIEKKKGFGYTGVIMMNFKNSTYAMEDDGGAAAVQAILTEFIIDDIGIPVSISIELLDHHYELKYKVLIQDKTVSYNAIIDEQKVVRILTLFLFDYYTIIGEFNIVDIVGDSFLYQKGSYYKRGMWDLIHYQYDII